MSTTKNFIYNVLLVLLTSTPSVILNAFVQPYQRGFYCDDETIRKPKLDYEQIPTPLLVFLITIPPIIMISIANWLSHNWYECKKQEHGALKLTLNDAFLYFIGLGLTSMCVDISKFSIGRLRPNFYRGCEPRIAKFDQKTGKSLHECQTLGAETLYNYIVDYECTVKDSRFEKQMHLSFMSGHSAFMMYSAVYASIILIQRLRTHLESTFSRLIAGIVMTLNINLAVFVGFTRISDYWHHPTDVLTGLIYGTLMAVFVKYLIDQRSSSKCIYENDLEDKFPAVKMKTIENSIPELV